MLSKTSRHQFPPRFLGRHRGQLPEKSTVSVCFLCYNRGIDNTNGQQDTQLRILQSVAAHVKLLLDTPEHIWRLLEKKKYLYAGWLFLLARIVYQALVRDDAEDEDDWAAHGIDMLVRGSVYGSSFRYS